MKATQSIRVLIGRSVNQLDQGQADDVIACDTMQEARAKARHVLTEEFCRLTEVTEPFNVARIMRGDATERELWRKGYREPQN